MKTIRLQFIRLFGLVIFFILCCMNCKMDNSLESKGTIELSNMIIEKPEFRQHVLYELQLRDEILITTANQVQGDQEFTTLKNQTILMPFDFENVSNYFHLDQFNVEQLLEILDGEADNRQDFYLVSNEGAKKNFAGVAMVMKKTKIGSSGLYSSKQYSEWVFRYNGQDYKGCSSYRFINQFRIANCTAFAISPYHILTVGHEVNDINCYDYEFVFDMYMDNRDSMAQKIPKSKRFLVDYPVGHVLDSSSMLEYTIVRVLDRIPDERILKLDLDADYELNDRLYAIGASEGLPLKYAPDGQIVSHYSNNIINTNLNVHVGNSGSPVFNTKDHVIGMVVKGQSNQTLIRKESCIIPKSCSDYGCSGEYILKLSSIPMLKQILKNNNLL